MMKRLIVAVTALSLMLAQTTTAAADGVSREDVGKLLFGLVAIAAVNAALENRRERAEAGNDAAAATRTQGSWSDLANPQPRRDVTRRTLPDRCLHTVHTRYGALQLYGQQCLQNRYRDAHLLPQRCEVRVFADGAPRTGYDPYCLREHGFRAGH